MFEEKNCLRNPCVLCALHTATASGVKASQGATLRASRANFKAAQVRRCEVDAISNEAELFAFEDFCVAGGKEVIGDNHAFQYVEKVGKVNTFFCEKVIFFWEKVL